MKVIVIGGGAAGMMAAITAAEGGNEVTIFEQNEKLGKKLFLTGKGRCNLTNSCAVEELFLNIIKNHKFLYSAIYDFDNISTINFFEENGLKLKEERGGRIFPVSDHSSDVINTLIRIINRLNVNVKLKTKVCGFESSIDENGNCNITGVILAGNQKVRADRVIIATGGCSYPLTGSDGTAFEMVRGLGIDVNASQPSLVPLVTGDGMITKMQGLSLKNVSVKLYVGDRKKYEGFGEMLFTHFGVSGPLILSASAYLEESDYKKGVKLLIDLKPALDYEELDKRILRDFAENQNKVFENSLNGLLPAKIISPVIQKSGIDPRKRVNEISKEERHRLIEVLKSFSVEIEGNRGFNEAIITRGGVSVKEINPSTMESKKVKGLYFAGEMIDTDALTGGFNLQIAWSTGHLAGLTL